ncbi:MAG: DUF3597 domain-containing protein [Beijerinckiaceae bacterium]|nr:DUF3597 domain-containing protein [Beijerinckiaceae bacterium]
MSIFGTIMSKILGRTPPSPVANGESAPSAQAATEPGPATAAAAPAPPAEAAAPAGPAVDVAAVLDALKEKATQQLDWKHSIVDLMKLLSLDSSLAARKELAKELHYGGDTSDSAAMNIRLHKQIMKNLAANGGKLPSELKNLT